MTEVLPEAVSHSAVEGAHSMSTDCWCAPRRERFVYDNDEQTMWHWEVYNYETEQWEPKGDANGEG